MDRLDALDGLLSWAGEARTLLEETDLPVEAIAARVGLGSAVNLRRRFHAQVGTTPGAYRRALQAARTPTQPGSARGCS